jgi:dTDP-4-dehydrorhamnose 3,5-epimerase
MVILWQEGKEITMDYWIPSSKIEGVSVQSLAQFGDERGWLSELWRSDEDEGILPVMGYISMTRAGVARGPHEHIHQTDIFVFLAGSWKVRLWDNRVGSPTHLAVMDVEIKDPRMSVMIEPSLVKIVVPPGVVHAYANVAFRGSYGLASCQDGFVFNFPDKLYRGRGKQEPEDEIRHEGNPIFSMEGMP